MGERLHGRHIPPEQEGTNPRNTALLPISHSELLDLMKNKECGCDECNCDYYQDLRRSHRRPQISLSRGITFNQLGNMKMAYVPLNLQHDKPYEAMHLVRMAIKYFNRPAFLLNDQQLEAVDYIRGWIQKRTCIDILHQKKLFETFQEVISEQELTDLLDNINQLFFAKSPHDKGQTIDWDPMTPGMADMSCGHIRHPEFGLSTHIRMDPHCQQCGDSEPVPMTVLGTLLHEAAHAFIARYTHRPSFVWAQDCGIAPRDDIMQGHGLPWLLLATAMEESFLTLFGLPVYTGTLDEFRKPETWESNQIPNIHNFNSWRPDRLALQAIYLEDVREQCRKEEEIGNPFHPEKYYKEWYKRYSAGPPSTIQEQRTKLILELLEKYPRFEAFSIFSQLRRQNKTFSEP